MMATDLHQRLVWALDRRRRQLQFLEWFMPCDEFRKAYAKAVMDSVLWWGYMKVHWKEKE